MNAQTVVADASPIIALGQIDALDLLQNLFTAVLIPPAVRAEVRSVTLPAWIRVRTLTRSLEPGIVVGTIGPGESEAIGLAREISADFVILDDRPARMLAERLELQVIGTLGVLLLARRRQLLTAIRPHLEALRSAGFFFDGRLYRHLLALAGE